MKFLSILPLILFTYIFSMAQHVTDFALKNTNNELVSLHDFDNKNLVLVVFFSNDCPYAKLYINRLKKLHKKFDKDNTQIILINSNNDSKESDETTLNMKELSERNNFPFPYLKDENQLVAKEFRATKTPEIYLLKNKNKKFEIHYSGAIDNNPQNEDDITENYIENAIYELLNNKNVTIKKTRAVGCTIKWK